LIELSLATHAWQLVKGDKEVVPEGGDKLEGGLGSSLEVPNT